MVISVGDRTLTTGILRCQGLPPTVISCIYHNRKNGRRILEIPRADIFKTITNYLWPLCTAVTMGNYPFPQQSYSKN